MQDSIAWSITRRERQPSHCRGSMQCLLCNAVSECCSTSAAGGVARRACHAWLPCVAWPIKPSLTPVRQQQHMQHSVKLCSIAHDTLSSAQQHGVGWVVARALYAVQEACQAS
jgi:hypothetical protein